MEDIIPLIVAQVNDYLTLCALALVTKRMNRLAITRLYDTVRLSTSGIVKLLTQTPRRLSAKIKHLELRISVDCLRHLHFTLYSLGERIIPHLLSPKTLNLTIESAKMNGGIRIKHLEGPFLTDLFAYLFGLLFTGPSHFRVRYTVLGKSSECPCDCRDQIMHLSRFWTSTHTLDLPMMGILSHAYGPEWQIKAKNQIDRISVSRSVLESWDLDMMGQWLYKLSSLCSNKPNLDSKKDLSETFKIVLEVRQSASEELNDDVQEFLKHNDPEGVFEIVFVGEERENEAVKIWRDRETSLN